MKRKTSENEFVFVDGEGNVGLARRKKTGVCWLKTTCLIGGRKLWCVG